jgi:hypothetical protein
VNPRCRLVSAQRQVQMELVVDGLEAGYVWDDKLITSSQSPSTRRPKKDGEYDHLQNCLEYIQLAFGVPQSTTRSVDRAERTALARAQRDTDEYNRTSGRRVESRGGY